MEIHILGNFINVNDDSLKSTLVNKEFASNIKAVFHQYLARASLGI
jgi:hypothetical protein